MTVKTCPYCYMLIMDAWKYCAYCGKKLGKLKLEKTSWTESQ